MIILTHPCPANTMRGQLKHSWLENEVFFFDSDDVVSLWKDGEWSDKVESVFPLRVQQTIELTESLVDGFSPAQLVDQLNPLMCLSVELRTKLKAAVHDAYLSDSKISAKEMPLRESSLALKAEFEELRKLWKSPKTVDNEKALRCCWGNIRTKGKVLHALLEKIPKGIVLP